MHCFLATTHSKCNSCVSINKFWQSIASILIFMGILAIILDKFLKNWCCQSVKSIFIQFVCKNDKNHLYYCTITMHKPIYSERGKNLHWFQLYILENSTKITLLSHVYGNMLKWHHFNPICTKTFCRFSCKAFMSFKVFQNIEY